MLTTDLSSTFFVLLTSCVFASVLTGSTLQWILVNGKLSNQYNILVTVAAIASLIQSAGSFVNYVMAPEFSFGLLVYNVLNWMIMTHFSVMLVSKKLSLTFNKTEQKRVWHRLLLINVAMLPISIFVFVYWVSSHTVENEIFDAIKMVVEPLQIALWGIIEFSLSGAFIFQMWKYKWSDVERKAIYVLVLIGMCDIVTMLLNILMGDLESTVVKGLIYAIRIRLEVAVLGQMVEYVRKKRAPKIDGQQQAGGQQERAPEDGTPGAREAASPSWGMLALTQVVYGGNEQAGENAAEVAEAEDHATNNNVSAIQKEGAPGARQSAPPSWGMMALTEVEPVGECGYDDTTIASNTIEERNGEAKV